METLVYCPVGAKDIILSNGDKYLVWSILIVDHNLSNWFIHMVLPNLCINSFQIG